MSKTMAEVLADHHSKSFNPERSIVFCLDITCGWDAENFAVAAEVFAQHQQDMLTAAGFGLVADAKGEALEEAAEELPFMSRPITRLVRHKEVASWLRVRARAVRGEG